MTMGANAHEPHIMARAGRKMMGAALLLCMALLSAHASAEPMAYPPGNTGYVDAEAGYSPATGAIAVVICGFTNSRQAEDLNVHYAVLDGSDRLVRESYVSGQPCYTGSVQAQAGRYSVVVNDLRNGGQFYRELE